LEIVAFVTKAVHRNAFFARKTQMCRALLYFITQLGSCYLNSLMLFMTFPIFKNSTKSSKINLLVCTTLNSSLTKKRDDKSFFHLTSNLHFESNVVIFKTG
jgi:hypothetical protein